MELISEDALHMRMLSATLLSIRRHRNANLQEFCKSLIDLYATTEGDTLVGNVFASQEEFAAWFKFAQDFVGTERASMPEGSNRADLEELASLVSHIESSPVAGPSSFAAHPCFPHHCTCSFHPLLPILLSFKLPTTLGRTRMT